MLTRYGCCVQAERREYQIVRPFVFHSQRAVDEHRELPASTGCHIRKGVRSYCQLKLIHRGLIIIPAGYARLRAHITPYSTNRRTAVGR